MIAPPSGSTDLFAPVVQTLRAWPWLCDFQGHVNNARYLDLMSSARLSWLIQNRLLRTVVSGRMAFLIAGMGGVYRRPIPRLAAFVQQTRVASFDARWLYYEHTFRLGHDADGAVAARFLARGQLRTPDAALTPREALQRCGLQLPATAPQAPPDLQAWSAAQEACLDAMRA